MDRLTDLYRAPLRAALAASPPPALEALRGSRIVVTGGTGFLGEWLLRALVLLNEHGWDIRIHCISRDPAAFLRGREDWAGSSAFSWSQAGTGQFAQVEATGGATHVLHLATSSDARQNHADPLAVGATMVEGTLGCIALARRLGARLHYVSSGAVYGNRRSSDGPSRESDIERSAPSPLDVKLAYGNAKRMCESLVATSGLPASISRPFAFMGAGLPLDRHFAAGNFAADAVAGRPIMISGDGTPLRSYMHPADCAFWLLVLAAVAPASTAWNVGSPDPISIGELAHRIAATAGSPPPRIALDASGVQDPPAYWPDVTASRSMGLAISMSLDDCIQNTLAWAAMRAPTGVTA